MADWKKELEKKAKTVWFDEPMSRHTSFKIGGPADAFIQIESVEELKCVLSWCKRQEIPCMVMGNGSNMLVSDRGIEGVVLQIGSHMQNITIEGGKITAQCGVMLSKLASAAAEASLSGLEFAAGIPGTLGGAVYMNAGAYGGEMKDVVVCAEYLADDAKIYTAERESLDFGYRHSRFSDGKAFILSCVMELQPGDKHQIRNLMADYQKRRADKQPLDMPSAGSTFKRPEGYFAGKLIEDAGLKGYSIGGAQVSEKHSGFVVNTGSATAKDVMDLIEYIQKTVYERFQVRLETEVRLVGRR